MADESKRSQSNDPGACIFLFVFLTRQGMTPSHNVVQEIEGEKNRVGSEREGRRRESDEEGRKRKGNGGGGRRQ